MREKIKVSFNSTSPPYQGVREVSKHYSEASSKELQRREAEHLQAAVEAAVDAAENLRTALHELGQVTGDNPLNWSFQEADDIRDYLNRLIENLEGGGG